MKGNKQKNIIFLNFHFLNILIQTKDIVKNIIANLFIEREDDERIH